VRTARTVLSALGVLLLLAAAGIPWRSNQLTNNQTSSDRGAGSRSLRLCSLQRAMVSAAVAVPLRTVRAIGVNATGRTVEPEATDALATGYWLAAGAAIAIVLVTMLYAFGSGRG
jgi:hypothetical protein